ncbi:hypothetical protein ACFUCV_11300 [Specibacter sp. NPDC057265]|uniref:hypothetical protein n=1 Tax=Specibacter sp. NPDC057265 TaxID=3346075 RepID=UPI00362C7036
MPAVPPPRRRVQLFLVPLIAAFCMAFIIGAIVMDRDGAACPAASWDNHLNLKLLADGADAKEAAAVTACMGAKCVAHAQDSTKTTSGTTRALIHEANGSWQLSLGAQAVSTIDFTVYDKNGAVLATRTTQVNWTRISGSERCGGAMADVGVVLEMP